MSVQALSCAFAVRGLTPSEKLVLLALANFANEKMQCWPSQERLAADTELSPRTVWSALKSLEDRRVLSRTSRKRQDGTRTTDVFTLHFALEVWSEPVATVATRTRNSCESQSQSLQEPVAAVATLTTFEPSDINHQEEPLVFVAQSAPTTKGADTARGSRLPEDWEPQGEDWLKALDLMGGDQGASNELDRFRDYWRGVPGAKGRKTDWAATWRNWIRKAAEDHPNARRAHGRPHHLDPSASGRAARRGVWAEIAAEERGQTARGRS